LRLRFPADTFEGNKMATKSDSTSLVSRQGWLLILASLITIALYFIPYGRYVIYPLMLFSTFAHEMGHGLTAILMGGQFVDFKMWSDGSGVARHLGSYGAVSRALISAGGLTGPALLGAAFFGLSRTGFVRLGLYLISAVAAFSLAFFVRNAFGVFFVVVFVMICLAFAKMAPEAAVRFFLVFLGMQLSVTVFSRGDYLFMQYAETSGGRMPSDVMQISDAIGGPYWLWGAMVGLLSIGVLVAGLWVFLRGGREEASAKES